MSTIVRLRIGQFPPGYSGKPDDITEFMQAEYIQAIPLNTECITWAENGQFVTITVLEVTAE